jgi:hypothetical protein
MRGHDLKRLRQYNKNCGMFIKESVIAKCCDRRERTIQKWIKDDSIIKTPFRNEIRALYENELKTKIDDFIGKLLNDVAKIVNCRVIMLAVVRNRNVLILRANTVRLKNNSAYSNPEMRIKLHETSLSTATLTGYAKIINLCGNEILNHPRKSRNDDLRSIVSADIVHSLLEIPFFLENNSPASSVSSSMCGPIPAFLLSCENKLDAVNKIIEVVHYKNDQYIEDPKIKREIQAKNGGYRLFSRDEVEKIEGALERHLSPPSDIVSHQAKSAKYPETLTTILNALDYFTP